MPTVQEIADDTVRLNREMNFEEAGKHWADDVVSIEPMEGPMARVEGIEAVRQKGEWWKNTHEMHGVQVDGPWLNGDQFTVRYQMDVTVKETGQRMQGDEIGLYTVKDGKISEEKFYSAPMPGMGG